MSTQEEFRLFILSILNDDEGISEDSWDRLTDYLQAIGEMELIGELAGLVKSCNGRRYVV